MKPYLSTKVVFKDQDNDNDNNNAHNKGWSTYYVIVPGRWGALRLCFSNDCVLVHFLKKVLNLTFFSSFIAFDPSDSDDDTSIKQIYEMNGRKKEIYKLVPRLKPKKNKNDDSWL